MDGCPLEHRASQRRRTPRPRRLSRALPLLVAGLAAASAGVRAQAPSAAGPVGRELLNSERIEARFGSYGIEVLQSDGHVRVSNLYSGSGDARICRTFAAVRYPQVVDAAFADEHAAILAGQSIGATFVAHGWTVVKSHRYFGTLPAGKRVDRLMGGVGAMPLAVHVYTLEIERGGEHFEYAGIAEVHHPDYLRLADLRRIYAADIDWPTPVDDWTAEMLALTVERMR
jgi:hypothetical protein